MKLHLLPLALIAGLFLTLNACLKDPETGVTGATKGDARIEITDAPTDDPNVKAVFVTVADIKVDGKSWAGFDGKVTIDPFGLPTRQNPLAWRR
jgi:hypothetical protein